MNERIKELALQAGQIIVLEINGVPQLHYYAPGDGWVTIEPLVKNFAELIVRECAKVYWNIDDGELHSEYVNALKGHFGVE